MWIRTVCAKWETWQVKQWFLHKKLFVGKPIVKLGTKRKSVMFSSSKNRSSTGEDYFAVTLYKNNIAVDSTPNTFCLLEYKYSKNYRNIMKIPQK